MLMVQLEYYMPNTIKPGGIHQIFAKDNHH